MSDNGHPTRALQDFRGDAHRREVYAERGLPREGSVAIYEVKLASGGWRLDVEASWRGVPVGAPPVTPGTRPGVAHETLGDVAGIELARAVARAAEDDLRALRTPDLLASLARLRAR